MDAYTMIEAEAAIYDSGNHAAIDQLHRTVDDRLRENQAEATEIYHPGNTEETGFVAWVYYP